MRHLLIALALVGLLARQPWTDDEKSLIKLAALRVAIGRSIYGQVKQLRDGPLSHRSWDSIRNALNRERWSDHGETQLP